MDRSFSFSPSLGNPSSTHSWGRALRARLSQAREQVALSLGLAASRAEELVFCASGTEANQLPLGQLLKTARIWALSRADHPSVRAGIEAFRSRGHVIELDVDPSGRVELSGLPEQVDVLSLLWVNNETGAVLELANAIEVARSRGVKWIHVDAAQAWGKIPVRLAELNADVVSFSGHKIGALAGSGVFWASSRARAEIRSSAQWPGRQEFGMRPGTESAWAAIALGAAAQGVDPSAWEPRCRALKNSLIRELRTRVPQIVWNAGSETQQALANVLNFRVPGSERPGWVAALDLRGFAVSAGAACSAGAEQPSHVLRACGLSDAQARASVRVSWGPETQEQDLLDFAAAVADVAQAFRNG
jgi:cysteine desulfurase